MSFEIRKKTSVRSEQRSWSVNRGKKLAKPYVIQSKQAILLWQKVSICNWKLHLLLRNNWSRLHCHYWIRVLECYVIQIHLTMTTLSFIITGKCVSTEYIFYSDVFQSVEGLRLQRPLLQCVLCHCNKLNKVFNYKFRKSRFFLALVHRLVFLSLRLFLELVKFTGQGSLSVILFV